VNTVCKPLADEDDVLRSVDRLDESLDRLVAAVKPARF
jgi:hypothetical protein